MNSYTHENLASILQSINNNNKLQTLKKSYLTYWNWIVEEVNILYPSNKEPEKAYIYLLTHYPVQLI